DQRFVAFEPRVRARAAEARDRAVHERGVEGPQGFRTDAPSVRGAGCESLDDDVGVDGELAQLLTASACSQIRDGALFAAVPHDEARRRARAEPVAFGRFDLD